MNKVLCNIWFDFKTTHSKDSGYVKFHRENDRFINGDIEIRRVLLKWSHEYFIPSPDTIERNNGHNMCEIRGVGTGKNGCTGSSL